MTEDTIEDTYPHWRDALFGNHSAYANIKCAIHYVLWHGAYAVAALIGGLILFGAQAGNRVSKYCGPLAGPISRGSSRVYNSVRSVLTHEYAQKIYEAIFIIMLVGSVLFTIVSIILIGVKNFWTLVTGFSIVGGCMLATYSIVFLYDRLSSPAKSAATSASHIVRRVEKQATETPGIRRVVGKCPVTLGEAPKWFNKLFPEDDE